MELSRIYLEKSGEKCHKEQRDRLFGIILLTKLPLVWGSISYTGRTRLKLSSGTLRANNYIPDPLEPKLLGFWAEHCTLRYFMQDNARLHLARTSLEWHQFRNISLVIEWPLFSPFEPHWKRLGVYETINIREKFKNPPGKGSDYRVILGDFGSKDHSKLDKFDSKEYSELFGCQRGPYQELGIVSFVFVFSPSLKF